MTTRPASNVPYPPRGMSRDEAARYVGVGVTKFDEMVRDGRMPKPFRVDKLVRWDIRRIDAALDNLVEAAAGNPWDKVA